MNCEARNGEVTKLTNLYTLYESVNSIDKTLFDTFNTHTERAVCKQQQQQQSSDINRIGINKIINLTNIHQNQAHFN